MKRNTRISRRGFLERAGAGAAALAVPYFVPARVLGQPGRPGPNDRIQIGVIGIGSRGKYQIGNIPPEGRVVAVSDWYTPRMDFVLQPETSSPYADVLADFRAADAKSCAKYQDYRQMIDEAKLDAVMVTACDQHHVLASILACRAGMDVYVEKPLSVTVREGRALVDAAKRYNCVVQVGSQQRSMEMNQFACKFVRDGSLGKISRVTLRNYPGPLRYEEHQDLAPPEELPTGGGWELYCGPTPLRPYSVKLWAKEEFEGQQFPWRGWDMWRDYSGHLMTNHGAHTIDMVQLALAVDHTGPVEIEPLTDGYNGEMRQCPLSMRYANGTELRFMAPRDGPLSAAWDVYEGAKGTLKMRRNGFEVDPPELVTGAPDPSVLEKWTVGGKHVARPHVANWLECIRSRGTPNSPVEAGHRTATICHLANISRELRRTLRWDPQEEVVVGDEEANALLERPRRPGFELPS